MAKDKKSSKAAAAAAKPEVSNMETIKAGRVTKPNEKGTVKSKEAAKAVAAKVGKQAKKLKKEPTPDPSSDGDDTSDSSASSDDESESETEVKPEPKSNGTAKAAAANDESSDGEDDSASDSDDETVPKSAAAPKANGHGKAAKEDDSDDESSDASDSDEENVPTTNGKGATAAAEEDDSDDSESDSEDEADAKAGAKDIAADTKMNDASSDSDSSSDEDEDAAPKAKADASDSSGDDSDSESEDEEEEEKKPKVQEQPAKKRKAEEAIDQTSKKLKAMVNGEQKDATPNLFCGNLSWNIDEEWLTREFEGFGELSGVRIITDRDSGRSKGYGYVEFADVSSAVKAIEEMSGTQLDGREIRLDFSNPRNSNPNQTPRQKSFDRAQKYGDTPKPPNKTLFVGNLSFDVDQDTLTETFQEFGSIHGVRIPTDRDSGASKGYGYVDFASVDEATAAFDGLTGSSILGRPIRLDYATDRSNDSPRGGGFGGRGGGRGRGDRGGRGGFNDRGRGRGGARGGRGGGSFNRGGFGDFSGKKTTF